MHKLPSTSNILFENKKIKTSFFLCIFENAYVEGRRVSCVVATLHTTDISAVYWMRS